MGKSLSVLCSRVSFLKITGGGLTNKEFHRHHL